MKIRFNRTAVAVVGFFLIAGYFLWAEHAAHIKLAIPYLPYLLLLACPLLHMFMHGGHGHGHDTEHQDRSANPDEVKTTAVDTVTRPSSIPRTGRDHD